uniref:HNH domain-containing protein n=1 Tax=Tetraselmis sp. GSL018 TaxID=582737 RepID=A0A061R0D0_9CHLO
MSAGEAAELRARWEAEYPVIPGTKDLGNGRERTRPDTSSDRVRRVAWDELKDLEATIALRQLLPKSMKDDFRVDPFGNVVSIRAEKRWSVCGFQVDHIFPWARGGLTEPNNLMALHWHANQHVKNDAILNANEVHPENGMPLEDRMLVGLSVEQLRGLTEMRDRMPSRSNQRRFEAQLQHLLWTPCVGLPNLSWPQRQGAKPFMRTLEPGMPCLNALHELEMAARADLFGTQ